MGNKNKEVGLEHILKLQIKAVREPRGIYNELTKKFGQIKAREIVDNLYGSAEKIGKQAMYEKKNENYDIAMIYTGCYDADIIRKACNWIEKHQDAFGDEILEIGCDCGFMTTFLGSFFPEKHIVAIDRNLAGINIAKINVEKFGLKNVEFICADAVDITDKKFDTVFSMRTLHENDSLKEKEDYSNELITQASIFTKGIKPYMSALSSLIKDNGKLVSIERMGRNALMLAWMQSLIDSGLKMDLDSYSELECLEVGDYSTFEAIVSTKEECVEEDVFMDFMRCINTNMDLTLPQYDGWDAKIMYEYTGGKLIEGVEIRDTKNGLTTRIACSFHKQDETCILWYQNYNGNVHLEYHDISNKDNCIQEINTVIKQVEELKYIKVTELEE